MDRTGLEECLDTLGTPSYLFDLDLFAKRAGLVRAYFGSETALCFSIKANPFLVGFLPDEIDRLEVCSPGELAICERAGVPMERVIFSGVNKSSEEIARAAEDGVGTLTAESPIHVHMLNMVGSTRGEALPVLLRVTDVKGGSQFGMDEAEVFRILAERRQYPGIRIVGLHYFTGTQKRKAKKIIEELDYLSGLIQRVWDELRFELRCVEYGTGLAVDYFSDDAETAEELRLSEIAESIRAFAGRTELTVEMGRFFAAPCGYYFTRVVDVKTNCGIRYAITDGGTNHLKYDGQLQGMQIPEILHLRRNDSSPAAEPEKWTVCGSLCTTADVLARNVELRGLEVGDILAFGRTGAYSVTEGIALFLSREIPAVAVRSGKTGLQLLRREIPADRFNTLCCPGPEDTVL